MFEEKSGVVSMSGCSWYNVIGIPTLRIITVVEKIYMEYGSS